ncbi:MAG: hypothetical protein KC464_31135, partial [Myxococcales bacterium]|nr:hypothetical protein [Myxococcales bacterium]
MRAPTSASSLPVASAVAAAVALAGLTTLGGCKGKDKHASDDTGVVRVADVKAERAQARRAATAACIDGLATPAPPGALDGGLGALLDRCQVCGVSWQPVVALSRIDPDDGPGPDVPPADRAI